MNKFNNNNPSKADQVKIEARQAQVAKLLQEGKVYREMRDILKISLGTIVNDVNDIINEWRTLQSERFNEHVTAELYRLLQIDEEAHKEWEESKTKQEA